MGKEIPTKEEIQMRIDDQSSSPRQIIISSPKRYIRGKEKTTRIWVEVSCSEHGPYQNPIRLDTLLRIKNRCYFCGKERQINKRTRSEAQIKQSVEKWSEERNFPVKYIGVSDDRKITFLECSLHGSKEKSTGKVVNSGQLCEECALELPTGGHIPFDEKLSAYLKKYKPPLVMPLREGPKKYKNGKPTNRSVFYKCLSCNGEFSSSWTSIYHKGIKGCTKCVARKTQQKRISPINEVLEKLKRINIDINNLDEYKGTHHPLDLICIKCKTKKKLKINSVLNNKSGMSCFCTRAIPNICHDYIFNHLLNIYPDSVSRKIFKNKKIEADIFIPSINTIVEVKYGDSPFGRENANGQAKKRYEHILKQAKNYSSLESHIIYLIIADKENIDFIPKIIKEFNYFLLNDKKILKEHPLLFSDELLKELYSLYETPYIVRSKEIVENKEKALIRKQLKDFLKKNNYKYPSQRDIKEKIGYSQKKVDSALWINRNSTMQDRVNACKYWFDMEVKSIRNFYSKQT